MDEELLEAARAGDAARVRELLRRDPALAGRPGTSGETPILAALYRGHAALAQEQCEALERSGTEPDIFTAAALGRLAPLDRSLQHAGAVNGRARDGWTALHLAAFFGRLDAARRLLGAGADVNAVSANAMANTPLHAAAAGGHGQVALLLIEAGADVNARDAGQHTPLHIAAEAGDGPVVKALLARGADPHAVDGEDKTPLSRAAARNHAAIVDLINVSR